MAGGLRKAQNWFVAYCVPTPVYRMYKRLRHPVSWYRDRKHMRWVDSLLPGARLYHHDELVILHSLPKDGVLEVHTPGEVDYRIVDGYACCHPGGPR